MEHSHEPAEARSFLDVWGHYAGECMIVAIAGQIFAGLYPQRGLTGVVIGVAIMALLISSFLVMRRHDRRLCETCMAELPLNPEAVVQRQQMRFWVTHTGSEPKYLVPYLVVVFGSSFAYNVIGRIPWAIIQATLIYLILAQITHRKLQPWCPWCKNGGDRNPALPDVLPSDDRLNA